MMTSTASPQSPPARTRRRRLAGAAARAGTPGLLAIAVLAAGGWLQPLPAAIAAVAVLLATVLAVWRPTREAERTVRHLALLADVTQPPAPFDAAATPVERGIRAAAKAWHEHAEALAGESATAARILDGLPDPLILIDRDRRVVRANAAAKRLFEMDPTGRDLARAIRHPLLLQAVDGVLGGEKHLAVDLTLPVPVERRYAARVEPVGPVDAPPPSGDAPAVLVLLQDLTTLHRGQRMHSDFVANVSHELRTPLSSLAGFIETLQGPARDDAEARTKFLVIMKDQTDRMTRLISDLLSLSRIELEAHTRPTATVELLPLLESIRDTVQIKAARREMPIELAIAARLPAVIGERDQLLQVFQNLVDNAVKYGRAGTTVRVSAALNPDGQAVAVSVTDQSDGIPREHLPRLTERFYRVDSARSRALGGTGLGLAIVKHIVNRHRGSLSVESKEGEGSTFTITLPAATLPAATLPAAAGQRGGGSAAA